MPNDVVKAAPLPTFDCGRLDTLMDDAGVDVILATSRHNVQYLLGGYRCFFFESIDAIGISRYLPIVAYPKGHSEDAVYVGSLMEKAAHERGQIRMPACVTGSVGSTDAMAMAGEVGGWPPK